LGVLLVLPTQGLRPFFRFPPSFDGGVSFSVWALPKSNSEVDFPASPSPFLEHALVFLLIEMLIICDDKALFFFVPMIHFFFLSRGVTLV